MIKCVTAVLLFLISIATTANAEGVIQDIKQAGKETGKAIKQTAVDIGEGGRQFGRETRDGVKGAAKAIKQDVGKVATDTKNGIKQAGREIRNGIKGSGK